MDSLSLPEKVLQKLRTNAEWDWLDQRQASTQYSPNTLGESQSVSGAVIPKTRQAISTLLTAANQYHFCIHPVSSNKNWGYASIQTNSINKPIILLDLSQLNYIGINNPNLGIITIEPGVTQQQLRTFLDQNNLPFMVPVTGAGPQCSVLSNALERGYGITKHTDHFAACTALKAILPHPDLCEKEYSSAVDELDESGKGFIDKTYKWGIGLYQDGMFTQSNLGIVTEMSLRLAKEPEAFTSFYVEVPSHERFNDAVDAIRTLLQDYGSAIGSINLMDRRRLIAMTVENPNLDNSERHFLSDEQVSSIAKEHGLPVWLIVGSISADKTILPAFRKAVKKRVSGCGKLIFSDSCLLKVARIITKLPLRCFPAFNKLVNKVSKLDEGIDIMLGRPNQVALPLAYWNNPHHRASDKDVLDPARDNCGLLWYAPLVPMDATELDHFTGFVRDTIMRHDIDPFITFTNLTHDCIDATVPITFDASDPERTARANECLKELIEKGRKKGYVPYRLPISHQGCFDRNAPFWQAAGLVKRAWDPNNVLTPGKYLPQ